MFCERLFLGILLTWKISKIWVDVNFGPKMLSYCELFYLIAFKVIYNNQYFWCILMLKGEVIPRGAEITNRLAQGDKNQQALTIKTHNRCRLFFEFP